MKWLLFIAVAFQIPATCFAGCELQVGDASVKAIVAELLERTKNINAIARGYGKANSQEAMWSHSLTSNILEVTTELFHLRDLIIIRNGVIGTKNQRLVQLVLSDALRNASEVAQVNKEALLGSTSLTANPALASEIARSIPTLERVINFGNTCPERQ